MSEALDAAKRDLGAEATILETRSFKRGGILGFGKKTIFEFSCAFVFSVTYQVSPNI